MESQPQNPEFRFNPENFHPWATFYFILYQNILMLIRLDFLNRKYQTIMSRRNGGDSVNSESIGLLSRDLILKFGF